jgi:hypothetical protein
MKIKDTTLVIVGLILLWGVVCAVRPYWDKYWLGQDIRVAAIYGTKHSVQKTRMLLTKKMMQSGNGFRGEDFNIEKNEHNNVTVSIEYIDEISIFGMTLKELEFTVEKTESEVEAVF